MDRQKRCFFTGRPDGRGHSCGGDSGAPLFRTEYDESGRMRKVLVGINHGASGRCGTFPTIFARVEDPSILNYIMGPRGDYCLNELSFLSWVFFSEVNYKARAICLPDADFAYFLVSPSMKFLLFLAAPPSGKKRIK